LTAAVAAHGVAKRYGSVVAVEDLTFAVQAGEILGVLGPNGAGKTTAIRVLTTIMSPSRGTFSVAGVPHTKPAEIRRRIGVLPESAGYPERETGEEYLRYHARLFGAARRDAEQAATRLLAEVGLGERAASRIATYSRGMRQRLGIARALVNDPSVVFLDEPTLGLDPSGHRQVLGLVRDIAQRRGATVIVSTHNLSDVEEFCTRVLIFKQGKVAVSGTVGEVTQAASAPRSGQLRVPVGHVERAVTALSGVPDLIFEPAEERDDLIRVFLAGPPGTGAGSDLNAALAAILDAGVPVLSFQIDGARLSTAFLAATTGDPR
jgi:ABC-2 type transport system ATP-binding protein